VLEAGLAGRLAHFAVHIDRLEAAAAYVADTIRYNYPTLKVPFHARWRHFVVEGQDRWQAAVDAGVVPSERDARARARFELAITSVLLDAGAGPAWRWAEPMASANGTARWLHVGRSEGLGLASLEAWHRGHFSSDLHEPRRVDAEGLRTFRAEDLAKAFMVSAANPLEGLEGRAALLQRLGETIASRPDLFGSEGRLGGLYDRLIAGASPLPRGEPAATRGEVAGASRRPCGEPAGTRERDASASAAERSGSVSVPAPAILSLLLEALAPIWPGRLAVGGVELGDTWFHSAIVTADETSGLIPFHKLSQWLSYSLIEPLQEAGVEVTDIDGLTGLAEYRNGGLFIDLGVIVPRSAELTARAHQPGEEAIVEWRALTVALLDRIAPLVRGELGLSPADLPLAAVLEGGTWSAGRRIAKEKRADGGPPLAIVSDGSVF
jgi:hypothetical protein